MFQHIASTWAVWKKDTWRIVTDNLDLVSAFKHFYPCHFVMAIPNDWSILQGICRHQSVVFPITLCRAEKGARKSHGNVPRRGSRMLQTSLKLIDLSRCCFEAYVKSHIAWLKATYCVTFEWLWGDFSICRPISHRSIGSAHWLVRSMFLFDLHSRWYWVILRWVSWCCQPL